LKKITKQIHANPANFSLPVKNIAALVSSIKQ